MKPQSKVWSKSFLYSSCVIWNMTCFININLRHSCDLIVYHKLWYHHCDDCESHQRALSMYYLTNSPLFPFIMFIWRWYQLHQISDITLGIFIPTFHRSVISEHFCTLLDITTNAMLYSITFLSISFVNKTWCTNGWSST